MSWLCGATIDFYNSGERCSSDQKKVRNVSETVADCRGVHSPLKPITHIPPSLPTRPFFLDLAVVIITGPPNGPVLFCSLATVVCNAAGGRAGGHARPPGRGRSGGRHCTAGQYGYVPLGRQLLIFSNVKRYCHTLRLIKSFVAKSSLNLLCRSYFERCYIVCILYCTEMLVIVTAVFLCHTIFCVKLHCKILLTM